VTGAASHTEHGDGSLARAGEILRTVVGGGHGIAIAGTDDHDEMGVFIEPAECVVGLRGPADHFVYRTQPEGARSGPGDTDLVMYSLRRYLRLATMGNPTVLLPLYAPAEAIMICHPLGEQLQRAGARGAIAAGGAPLPRVPERPAGAAAAPPTATRHPELLMYKELKLPYQ